MSVALNHDRLPSFRKIINHDIMNCTADGVVGNHLYSGRALGMSAPWDIIQLHPKLEPLWDDIQSHYERIGLKHSKNVIWHVHREELGEHVGFQPSVFFFGPHESLFWGDHEWMETVQFINSKNNFIAIAEQLGTDVPKTLCFDDAQKVTTGELGKVTYPCYAKAAISVAGVGIFRCENRYELQEALQRFSSGVPIQIQEEILAETFLNMQYEVVAGQLQRLAASQQVLDGFSHQGNRVPARYEPWEAVEPLAVWLFERGMKGVFAFDVAVVETPWGPRFPVIECNPRFNGASYPTAIAQKLGIRHWTAMALKTRHRSLASIDLTGLEFDPKTGEGVVLVNWGPVLVGKLLVIFAGSPERQQVLQTELRLRL